MSVSTGHRFDSLKSAASPCCTFKNTWGDIYHHNTKIDEQELHKDLSHVYEKHLVFYNFPKTPLFIGSQNKDTWVK